MRDLAAEQSRILQRLDIRQITQRLQAEGREELFRRDIGVGRVWRRAARAGGEEVGVTEGGDRVAADLLAEDL